MASKHKKKSSKKRSSKRLRRALIVPTPDKPGDGWLELEQHKTYRVYVHKQTRRFKAWIGNGFTQESATFKTLYVKIGKAVKQKADAIEIPKGTPVVFRRGYEGPWESGTVDGTVTFAGEYDNKVRTHFIIKPSKRGAKPFNVRTPYHHMDIFLGTATQARDMNKLRKESLAILKRKEALKKKLIKFDTHSENMAKLRTAARRIVREATQKA